MSSAEYKWPGGGELLLAGGTDWAMLGRKDTKGKKNAQEELEREQNYPNLYLPHRIKNLMDVPIAFVAAGSAAVHCIAGDVSGRVYAFGRNEKGQLGLGDLTNRQMPTPVTSLEGKKIVGGACGRFHTMFMTEQGEAYACGSNLMGQCGLGAIKSKLKIEELVKTPLKSLVEKVSAVAAGAEFSLWLCDGKVWSAGNPQYGQLGDGSDHQYNAKDSSIQILYEPQPTPKLIKGLADKTTIRIAAGHNHCASVDSDGCVYTWGSGNYGKLGHKVQKDEHTPKLVGELKGRMACGPNPVLAASGNATFVTVNSGQMFFWGKVKSSGDTTMYPMPEYNLQGWNVRHMACGPGTYAVAADSSLIIWGNASNGELAQGADGKRTSANPVKCAALEGFHTHEVALGMGFTAFLVDPKSNSDPGAFGKLGVYENTVPDTAGAADEDEVAAPKGKGAAGKAAAKGKGAAAPKAAAGKKPAAAAEKEAPAKGKAAAAASKGAGKKKKDEEEEEDDEGTEDDADDEDYGAKGAKGKRKAPAAGAKPRGRPKKVK